MKHGVWAQEEHDRFLEAIKMYPEGPWRMITQHVGSRSVRQVQTHAQKYHEKIARRMRGLRKERTKWARLEHRIEDDLLQLCREAEGFGVCRFGTPKSGAKPATPASASVAAAASKTIEPVVKVKSEPVVQIKAEPMTTAMSPHSVSADVQMLPNYLPSLDESLDFFIDCLSD